MGKLFDALGVSGDLIAALAKQNISIPTEIQKSAIPDLIEGKDLVGSSETGSGKTFAYLIPLLMKIDTERKENQAIIVAPTHELAMQIHREIETLVKDSGLEITSSQCIGGANIKRQIDKLKSRPQIITGSAGRIIELMEKRKISVDITTVIVDEADRMLDIQNFGTLFKMLKKTRRSRQTVLFSATITDETLERAESITKSPIIIRTEGKEKINQDIEHLYIVTEERDKVKLLRKISASITPERALVFINRSDEIAILSEKLKHHKLKAAGIHGSSKKMDRKEALFQFRKGKIQLLVSSDLSSRGLDIKDVNYIIHFDMTENPDLYLHRAGRTARAGAKGVSISLVTERELSILRKHAGTLGIKITSKTVSQGKIISD